MSEEKEQRKVEEVNSDHTTVESGDVIDERKLLRKLDLHLLPGLTLLFLLSFLDRSNGNNPFSPVPTPASRSSSSSRKCSHRGSGHGSAHEYVSPAVHSQHGPYHHLNQAGDQYLTTLTMYFIGYVLLEVPSNIVLKRTNPRFWLPTLTLVWGIVCTLMGVTQNFSGFLAARFFLGIAECGFVPGVTYYLSMWYKRNEQQYRIALFFAAPTLAGAFGGIFVSQICPSSSIYHSWAFRRLALPK